MNVNKIKQIFQVLANSIAAYQNADLSSTERLRGTPKIVGGELMAPEIVAAGSIALHEIVAMTDAEGVWSASSVDDIVWGFITRILKVPGDNRKDAAVRTEVEAMLERFQENPSHWIVDRMVYGIHQDCAGVTFGNIQFVTEDMSNVPGTKHHGGFPKGIQMFGRLDTIAIDEESALQRAANILDEHLMILNALCSAGTSSWIQVSRADYTGRLYSAHRVGPSRDLMGNVEAAVENVRIPLVRRELDELLKRRVAVRISQMLVAQTEFNKRVLSGYQFAGAGCVDSHPERSFLMLAIALESVILGKKKKSELGYQLASRAAHLIGKGLNGRKLVAKTVSELYDRRSRIVHAGEYGVSSRELALMHFYCLSALGMLALSPAFSNFTTDEELEGWFKDRMLDGPDHLTPAQEVQLSI